MINIPQGASRDIILKCWEDPDKTIPSDLTDLEFGMLIKDCLDGAVASFTTKDNPDAGRIEVTGDGELTIHLLPEDTVNLKGKHHFEFKVSRTDGKVDVQVLRDVVFTVNVIGKNSEL